MELQITALENGIVIDHIPPERTFAIVKMLKLKEYTDMVTVGFNLHSKAHSKKGLIKIADKTLTKSELEKFRCWHLMRRSISLKTVRLYRKYRLNCLMKLKRLCTAKILNVFQIMKRYRRGL